MWELLDIVVDAVESGEGIKELGRNLLAANKVSNH